MSSTPCNLFRDRTYPTHHVSDLPRSVRLSDSPEIALSVDYAREGDLAFCRRMVEDAAKAGDNVGEDEYNDEDFHLLFSYSEIFGAKNNVTDEMSAFIVIQPCLISRTVDTCITCVYVFYNQDLGNTSIYVDLLLLGLNFSASIDIGYTECLIRVSPACSPGRVDDLKRIGFLALATIPDSVLWHGALREDYIMVKHFGIPDRQRRSVEDVVKMIEDCYPQDRCSAIYNEAKLSEAQFLPKTYTFRCGLTAVIRSARKDDDQIVYDMMTSAARAGRGYGASEFPTLDSFRIWMMISHLCVIFEEFETKKIFGSTFISDSWFIRNKQSKTGETSAVIADEYQGRGLGKEVIWLEMAMMKELGYTASVNDFLASNLRISSLIGNMLGGKQLDIGVIPKGSYTEGVGWDNQIIQLYDFDKLQVPHFSDFVEENRLKYVHATSKL